MLDEVLFLVGGDNVRKKLVWQRELLAPFNMKTTNWGFQPVPC